MASSLHTPQQVLHDFAQRFKGVLAHAATLQRGAPNSAGGLTSPALPPFSHINHLTHVIASVFHSSRKPMDNGEHFDKTQNDFAGRHD